MKDVSSPHNPIIREIEQLQRKSRARKKSGLFIIEGKRELNLAYLSDYSIPKIIVCSEILMGSKDVDSKTLMNLFNSPPDTEFINVTKDVYEKIAYRSKTEGCIAFAKAKNHSIEDLNIPKEPLILIAESIEKPGNIGALLRTADAAGVDAVILASPVTDLYNPNVIRSSVGGVFTTQIAVCSTTECVEYLANNNIHIYSATLQDSTIYTSQDYNMGTAIAVGTEDTGLSNEIRNASKSGINIPMRGRLDSMNVSVSASILLFEAVRQRNT